MTSRLLKCQVCKEKSKQDQMEVEEKINSKSGKVTRKYYHKGECWDSFLKDKAFKENEKKEQDYLWEVFEKVYGFPIPAKLIPYLQDLRNGSILFGKMKKRSKQGYPYSIIAATYLDCEDKIEWANKNKTFVDDMAKCKYGLAIIGNNIAGVKERIEIKAMQEKEIERSAEQEIRSINTNLNSVYSKKKRVDVSDLFD